MRRHSPSVGLLAGTIALATAACGGGSTSAPPAPSPETTITITSNGVSPKSLTIAVGSQVTFVNSDTRSHNMYSDPHPEHTDCPEFDSVGFLSPGERRQTGNLNTLRTCGFHDHDDAQNARWNGKIVIQSP